jgi:hypothetical protein
MMWGSRGIPVRFTQRPHGTPQLSTAAVDSGDVGTSGYAAATVVSHTFPSPYGHGFENRGRTSMTWEVNR